MGVFKNIKKTVEATVVVDSDKMSLSVETRQLPEEGHLLVGLRPLWLVEVVSVPQLLRPESGRLLEKQRWGLPVVAVTPGETVINRALA